ncbi:MAG: hypothetical protein Q7U47_11665 [Paludibacter sp.]|nr:hypothetical protein [Paludibacter sp.]
MRTPELKEFIRQNNHLFWYIPEDKKEEISDELLLEIFLNYGTLNDFIQLKRLLGINYLSNIFFGLEGRKKMNYYPEIYNFFYLYFGKYAQGNSES